MKKISIIAIALIMITGAAFSQAKDIKPVTGISDWRLASRIWVKVLCMNKWNDGRETNSAMVVLRQKSKTGSLITNARVKVNGTILSVDPSIQEYTGNIGTLSPGQQVSVDIATKDGIHITGKVQATYFVSMIKLFPSPLTRPKIQNQIKWKYSNNKIYLNVVKLLRNETELFSTDVNGSSYTFNFKALGIGPLTANLKGRVISPWTSVFSFTGPVAPGSIGQFFTSATQSLN